MRGPILLSKFHAPEVRARRQEFDTNSRSAVGSIAKIYDAAFLLLFRCGIYEHDFRSQIEFRLQIKQPAMSVDDNCLAAFIKAAAGVTFAFGLDWNARKYA